MKLFKNWFPYFVIFGSLSFTIITTIIGYKYTEHSLIYRVYNVAIAFLTYAITIYTGIRKNYTFSFGGMTVGYIFVVGYLFSYVLLNNESKLAFDMWTYFIVWSLPAFLFGMVVSQEDSFLKNLWKTSDLFMLIISLIVIVNGIYFLRDGRQSYSTSGTITYQTLSYLSAFAFGLNYFLLFHDQNSNRLKFFKDNKLYRIFCLFLLLLQGVSLVVTGGRGGFILLSVYFLYVTFFVKGGKSLYIKFIAIIAIILFAALILNSNNPTISNGLKRIFSYITSEGIDMSETSYRDVNYRIALDLISQKLVFGYGIYGLFMYTFYPHNLFLEILLGGGVFYFLIFIAATICIVRKYIKIKRSTPDVLLLFIFLLYDLVMLMFSGSYLNTSVLWFFIGFIINYNLKKSDESSINFEKSNNFNSEIKNEKFICRY